MEQIKTRLRKLRDEKEMMQVDIANAVHIARGTYASYENGITPPVDMCIKLAAYFDVSVDYLLCVSNEKKPAAGKLAALFSSLSQYAGDKAPTASDIADLLTSAVRYYQKGAPSGDIPLRALKGFLEGLSRAMDAAVAMDLPALLDAANSAAVSALDIAKMPASLYENKEDPAP